MKKLVAIAICCMLTGGVALAAKGPQDVSAGRHNLSTSSAFIQKSDNEDEVCIFCHTPHGGANDTPLWNRSLSTATFSHYNSATLTLTALPGMTTTRAVNTESLLCLSCHDGSVALNSLINYSNDIGAPTGAVTNPIPFGMWGLQGANIGSAWDESLGMYNGSTLLSDDHPISFSYNDVRNNIAGNTLKLNAASAAEGAGVRFFPQNSGDDDDAGAKRVECSSCHDPHVDASFGPPADPYYPFLITTNSGSALCLACHIK